MAFVNFFCASYKGRCLTGFLPKSISYVEYFLLLLVNFFEKIVNSSKSESHKKICAATKSKHILTSFFLHYRDENTQNVSELEYYKNVARSKVITLTEF